jgi:aminobenzoyl-glutamate utilization protein B
VDLPALSDQDKDYLRKFVPSFNPPPAVLLAAMAKQEPSKSGAAFLKQHINDEVYDFVVPYDEDRADALGKASTDVGDASWQCPTAQFTAATWAPGTLAHSWQAVSQGKGRVAHNMTLYSGKVLALAVMRLLIDPETVAAARAEFASQMQGRSYIPVPPDANPLALPGRQA